jgi:hypothetical protein
MLRAKAVRNAQGKTSLRDKILSATDTVGNIAGIPVVAETVNAVNKSGWGRALLDKTLCVHPDAPVPEYHSDSLRKRFARRAAPKLTPAATPETSGKVVLFARRSARVENQAQDF